MLIEPACAITELQFVFPAAKGRSFLNEFFLCAASSAHQGGFHLKAVDQNMSDQVSHVLYPHSLAASSVESAPLLRIIRDDVRSL